MSNSIHYFGITINREGDIVVDDITIFSHIRETAKYLGYRTQDIHRDSRLPQLVILIGNQKDAIAFIELI